MSKSFAKFETKFAGVSQKRKFREICGALAARSAEKMGCSNLEEKVADSARKSQILVRFWSDFAKENHVCSDSATIFKFGGVQVEFCTADHILVEFSEI